MCVNHGSSAHAPSHARSTDRLRTHPRSSEGGWAQAASLRALSEAGQDIREPGKPGAWSGHLGDAAPEKSSGLRQERWRQALGAGLTLQLLGCWGSRAWNPGFLSTCCSPRPMLFPAPSSGLAELPPLEEDGPEHPPASDPGHPTHPWLAQRLPLSWRIVPGAPL